MEEGASFSEWLKRQRKERDLTQLELAERVGCSESAIRKFELGERRPSKQVVDLLADFFGVGSEERPAFMRFARGGDIAPATAHTGATRASDSGGRGETALSGSANLPAQLTSLVGRQEEVAAVTSLLSRQDVRLLTLTGPPGIGKTRLALQVAAGFAGMRDEGWGMRDAPADRLHPSSLIPHPFPDGVYFVPLAPITDGDLVMAAIAQTLGVKDVGGKGIRTALMQFLEDKHTLLVLDNFEQVVRAAPAISDLLGVCQHLKALVTSREVLRVQGEQQFPVPPLALPPVEEDGRWTMEDGISIVRDLEDYEAISLFVQRASAVKPGFGVTEENAEAVGAICSHLEGLPLAIELAAARTNLLTPQEIQARLGSSLKLLTGGARDLPPRQQTLRGAIDWSYSLLGQGEQTLFARLGVFVGGCTISAAEAVCNSMGDLPFNTLDGLSSLIEKSLLKKDEGGRMKDEAPKSAIPHPSSLILHPSRGESRYLMLEMIREYALEKLERSGEAEVIRRRHAEHYLSLAEVAKKEFSGADQSLWLNRLERDHDNLRAALEWSRAQASSAAISLRLAASLSLFWEVRGNFTESRQRLAAALSGSGAGASELAHLRAEVLGVASVMAFHQGDYSAMPPVDKERLEIYKRAEDKRGMASALTQLARAAVAAGDYASAHSLLEQTLALRRELGNKIGICHALSEMGELARCEGDYGMARSHYEESLALARESGEQIYIAWQLLNLGHVAHHERDYKQATSLFAEGLVLFQQVGEPRGIANCLYGLAGAAGSQGLVQRAAQLFGSAEAILNSTGIVLEPADQMEYQHNLAASKSKLDPATWQTFWSKGEAMPMEEAIAYALDEISRDG